MDRIDRLLSRQLQSMNRHLAKEKKVLEQLLKEEKPEVILHDGMRHFFNKNELELIARLLPEEKHRILMLPIYIELNSSKFGKGTARVCGISEVMVISKLLDKKAEGDEMFIYRPEIRIIRKKLPTTTQYMLTATLG